jgi:AAA15 family ATPase/GTPase
MRISSIRTAGFKSIEQLDVNPGSINIITGRNNTGKTSFLESIDTAFNPQNIGRFSENLNKIININSKTSSISANYIQTQQTLDKYSSSGNNTTTRELAIREPRKDEAVEIFVQALQDIIELNKDYPVRIPAYADIFDENEMGKRIQDSSEEAISTLSKSQILPEARENMIIIEIDGKEYPYIHLGDFYDNIREMIVEEATVILRKKLDTSDIISEPPEEEKHDVEYMLDRGFHEQFVPRFGSNRFVGGEPPSVEGVRMVGSPILEAEDIDMDQPNAGRKRSDIEEYLRENDILENLVDFSFDKIVLKEDGSKDEIPYSLMGDGFKTLVGILWEVIDDNRRENILLLEEPDVHMHPGYIENLLTQLVGIIRKNNIQIFITTHNPDLIEGFFSNVLKSKENDFLQKSFKLIQLTDPIPRTIDYESAENEIKDLNVDLRGI